MRVFVLACRPRCVSFFGEGVRIEHRRDFSSPLRTNGRTVMFVAGTQFARHFTRGDEIYVSRRLLRDRFALLGRSQVSRDGVQRLFNRNVRLIVDASRLCFIRQGRASEAAQGIGPAFSPGGKSCVRSVLLARVRFGRNFSNPDQLSQCFGVDRVRIS